MFLGINVRYILQSLIPRIDDRWPDATQWSFRLAATTAALGVIECDQFTAASALAHQALETALRQRFEREYPDGIPLRLVDGTLVPCADLDAFNANRRGFKGSRFEFDRGFTGSYADLVEWCAERQLIDAETADIAFRLGILRNGLRHSSSESRLLPGPALNVIDRSIAIARAAWFGEPPRWDEIIVQPPWEALREVIEHERRSRQPNDV